MTWPFKMKELKVGKLYYVQSWLDTNSQHGPLRYTKGNFKEGEVVLVVGKQRNFRSGNAHIKYKFLCKSGKIYSIRFKEMSEVPMSHFFKEANNANYSV